MASRWAGQKPGDPPALLPPRPQGSPRQGAPGQQCGQRRPLHLTSHGARLLPLLPSLPPLLVLLLVLLLLEVEFNAANAGWQAVSSIMLTACSGPVRSLAGMDLGQGQTQPRIEEQAAAIAPALHAAVSVGRVGLPWPPDRPCHPVVDAHGWHAPTS